MSSSPNPFPSQSDAIPSKPTSSPTQSLAFVVHSPQTVQNNLPPDVDNKPLARQKRRRTSKEDEEVLKAEYEKNPKPDKATRIDIVSKVALGEKEVQIWFQNKRQNDRRRSRPDQPSSDRVEAPSSDMQEQNDLGNEEPVQEQESDTQLDASSAEDSSKATADNHPLTPSVQSNRVLHDTPFTDLNSSQPVFSSQDSQISRPKLSGYIANRRNASFIKIHEDASPPASAPETAINVQAARKPRTLGRSRSFVRLSMMGGQAKVITDADQSPSPPRRSLRRSYSAAGLYDRLPGDSSATPSPKLIKTTVAPGSSRDSRLWENLADADIRQSLVDIADEERDGSAASAIKLIRASSRGALKPMSGKRNSMLVKQSSAKLVESKAHNVNKPALARSATSQARLQSQAKKSNAPRAKPKKTGDGSEEFETLNTESDKENWEPNENQSSLGPRRTHSQNNKSSSTRRPLGENSSIMSQSNSLGAMMKRERGMKSQLRSKTLDSENIDPEADDEIAKFMGSARPESRSASSVSSGEELGCAQGLLKLSQGNWR